MNADKIDLRNDPSRSIKARAAATRAIRERAVSAYAIITPIVLEMRGRSMSLGQIADGLNGAGHRTRKGSAFTRATISRIIARAQRNA